MSPCSFIACSLTTYYLFIYYLCILTDIPHKSGILVVFALHFDVLLCVIL